MNCLGLIVRIMLVAFLLVGCANTTKPPLTPVQKALVALDTSTCLATDVLPGVPALVDHLAAGDRKVAEQTIFGLIAGIGQVSKSVACYLRAEAAVRTQVQPACLSPEMGRGLLPGEHLCAPGELAQAAAVDLIRNRAAACGESCGREKLYASILIKAAEKGLVALR